MQSAAVRVQEAWTAEKGGNGVGAVGPGRFLAGHGRKCIGPGPAADTGVAGRGGAGRAACGRIGRKWTSLCDRSNHPPPRLSRPFTSSRVSALPPSFSAQGPPVEVLRCRRRPCAAARAAAAAPSQAAAASVRGAPVEKRAAPCVSNPLPAFRRQPRAALARHGQRVQTLTNAACSFPP